MSKAENEMFEHSCAVIEAKLEHFVENELKPDRFLGDADYSIVWRYMPVLSAQQYWHRIRTKKIILTAKEKVREGGAGCKYTHACRNSVSTACGWPLEQFLCCPEHDSSYPGVPRDYHGRDSRR